MSTYSLPKPAPCSFSEVQLPEKSAEVGSLTNPKVPPPNPASKSLSNELQLAGVGTGGALFAPPNMAEVYYKEPYDEFIKLKEAVVLKSLCWTPKQSIYIGCDGGQLLIVDVDSGCTTVVVNPQSVLEVNSSCQCIGIEVMV